MTKFDEYVEGIERAHAQRKRDELNEVLQKSLRYGSQRESMAGLYKVLGLAYTETPEETTAV